MGQGKKVSGFTVSEAVELIGLFVLVWNFWTSPSWWEVYALFVLVVVGEFIDAFGARSRQKVKSEIQDTVSILDEDYLFEKSALINLISWEYTFFMSCLRSIGLFSVLFAFVFLLPRTAYDWVLVGINNGHLEGPLESSVGFLMCVLGVFTHYYKYSDSSVVGVAFVSSWVFDWRWLILVQPIMFFLRLQLRFISEIAASGYMFWIAGTRFFREGVTSFSSNSSLVDE